MSTTSERAPAAAPPTPADDDAKLQQVGLSWPALCAFVKSFAGKEVAPSRDEPETDGEPPRPLPFEELSTEQVVWRIIRPATAQTGCSYAELLQQQVRTNGLSRRVRAGLKKRRMR